MSEGMRDGRVHGVAHRMRRRVGQLAVAAMMVAVVAAASADRVPAPEVALRNLDGGLVDPFDLPDRVQAIVFVFASVDCPISNRYAPVIQDLHDRFASDRIRFWLIYPNPRESPGAIRTHLESFGYALTALRDPEHALVKLAKATVTPEAAVFGRTGPSMYRGRIDNRYISIGLERPAPTAHDLEDVLVAIADGRRPPQRVTQPVGCFIADFVP